MLNICGVVVYFFSKSCLVFGGLYPAWVFLLQNCVHKLLAFTTVFPSAIHSFYPTIFSVLIPVINYFLPTIHKANNKDYKLIYSY